MGRDESVCAVQSVWDSEFSAHCAIVTLLFFRLCFRRNCHSCNGMFRGNHGSNGSPECELYRTTNLSCVYARAHYGSKRPNVEEVLAHPLAGLIDRVSTLSLFVVAFQEFRFANGLVGS